MTPAQALQPQSRQQDADSLVRLGGWLFRQRSWLPVPFALLLILLPGGSSPALWLTGSALVAAGEALRLWGVHHIGVISRTRSDRLGPLIDSGPFAYIRNPLYVGNIALWVGFAVVDGQLWLVPVIVGLLAFEYHAIVRWEETLLEARLEDRYREYASRVPRWLPLRGRARPAQMQGVPSTAPFSWRQTLFSERGTLMAIALGFVLLSLKAR
jgi:protein-S-isoprenylcysteine O-methyltransferase Ste14